MKTLKYFLPIILLVTGFNLQRADAQEPTVVLRSFGDSLGYTFGWRFAESLQAQSVPANHRIVVAGFADVFMQRAPLISASDIVGVMKRADERQKEIQARVERGDSNFDFARAMYGKVTDNTPDKIRTWNDTMSYLLGNEYGNSLRKRHADLSPQAFALAVEDFFAGESARIDEQGELEVNLQLQRRREEVKSKSTVDIEAEMKFMQEVSERAGITELPSGIMYEVVKEGEGVIPQQDAIYTLHFISSFREGEPFLNTWEENQPLEISLAEADPNWIDILKVMKVGATYRLFIPPNIGYARAPSDMPKRVLVYEMTLVEASDSDFSLDDI